MATIQFPYDNVIHSVNIPDVNLGEIVAPNPLSEHKNPSQLIEMKLSCPENSLALEEITLPDQRVSIIIDDISRPTPTADILPHVLNHLTKAGILRKNISIIIALGSHRPLSHTEIISKIGSDIACDYHIVNVSCDSDENMCFIGNTPDGIPAEVNRWVLEADLRIGIGAINPHMDAGFSGGGKIILPGVCSCRTVNAFHTASANIPGNQLGNPEAPTRLRLEEFVAQKVPLNFIVNVILHPNGKIYQCVTGHFVSAQRKGAKYAQELYGVKVKKRYPLVIVNSYPFEMDFWQCTKAFWSGELMASDGGMVVMVSPCTEGTATHPLWEEYLGWKTEDLIAILKSGIAEDPNACAFAIMFNRLKQRVRFGVVSPAISKNQTKRMKLTHFDSIEHAVKVSVAPDAKDAVSIITHGGTTMPILTY